MIELNEALIWMSWMSAETTESHWWGIFHEEVKS
jgi:hypothetical protein